MEDIKNIIKEIKRLKSTNSNHFILYSQYVAEYLDKNIAYSEYVAENINSSPSYSEYLAEEIKVIK